MERKNVVLLTVIAVATLLTAMVGSTFAYFTASVDGTGNDTEIVNATTAEVSATYTDGSTISISDIGPGWASAEKTISIKNTSEVDIDYTIDINSYSNTFTNLEYKLVDGEDGNNANEGNNIVGKQESFKALGKDNLNGTNNTLVSGHLKKNETHVFKLSLQLKETNNNQTEADSGKTFSGKLFASAKASKVTE